MSNGAPGIDQSFVITASSDDLYAANLCGSLIDTAVRLKSVRDLSGFSQRELAKRAGVTNSSISMIEQGQVSPSIQSLSRILAAFPISLADFFSFKCSSDARRPPEGGFVTQPLVSPHQLDSRIEHLLAGQSTAFSTSAVDSCGVVLSGELQMSVLSGSELLAQGDSFYIPANRLFRLTNHSVQGASVFRCSLSVHKG